MSRDGLDCTAGWKTRAFIVARVGNGELSKYLHAIVRHRGEGNRSDRPEVSAELATKHRAAVARVVYLAQDGLDLGVAAVGVAKTIAIPRERVTTNVSNVLQDTCMVNLTICNGTHFKKTRIQLF